MRRLRRSDDVDMMDQMQRMFEDMQQLGRNIVPGGHMPIDIREENGEIILTADLPGINKEEISLTADSKKLKITAEGKEEIKEENEKYIKRERSQRMFSRTIEWPRKVDPNTLEASYEDGVLQVTGEIEGSDGHQIDIN